MKTGNMTYVYGAVAVLSVLLLIGYLLWEKKKERNFLFLTGCVAAVNCGYFLLAASEALTNAVFHAGARKLNIMLSERENQWTMRFTNDGTQPEAPVTEGGGLGSLRKKLEREGGTMTIAGSPDFVLSVLLPKKGGDAI